MSIKEISERLDLVGLDKFNGDDFNFCVAFLSTWGIDSVVKKHSVAGFPERFYVSYNGLNFDGSCITALDKGMGYCDVAGAQMELIKAAILKYRMEKE